MGSIVVVGSMAFDSIETPYGHADQALGGSANYFSLAASFFAPVKCVSVVGKDYPQTHLALLRAKGVDTSGIQQTQGKTFFWAGKYHDTMQEAETVETQLNVFENFEPTIPESYRNAEYVFLGNIMPELQLDVLTQVKKPKFVCLDTMNFWITGKREKLIEAISKTNGIIINEGELRLLTQTHNLVKAAKIVRKWGPSILVVKRGEYGAVLFHNDEVFSAPGLPLDNVIDPTGAGDTFAGGFMGFLAAQDNLKDEKLFKQAVIYGCVLASFTVQEFSFKSLLPLTMPEIKQRYQKFIHLTQFDE